MRWNWSNGWSVCVVFCKENLPLKSILADHCVHDDVKAVQSCRTQQALQHNWCTSRFLNWNINITAIIQLQLYSFTFEIENDKFLKSFSHQMPVFPRDQVHVSWEFFIPIGVLAGVQQIQVWRKQSIENLIFWIMNRECMIRGSNCQGTDLFYKNSCHFLNN